jgi:hypothetical protein
MPTYISCSEIREQFYESRISKRTNCNVMKFLNSEQELVHHTFITNTVCNVCQQLEHI